MNGQLKIFIVSAFLMSFAACTNRTSTPVVLGSQSSDTNDYSNSNSTLFDTSGGTSTTINSSTLFDTNLTPTETTQTNNTTTTTVTNSTTTQNICMDPNQNVLASSSSTSTGISTACYTGNYYLPQNYLNSISYQSYGSMDYCFRLVAQYGQQACSSSTSAAAVNMQGVFQAMQMAMVRCYRQVLSQQMMAAQWAPDQGQSYQGNDTMLLFLLKELMAN